MELLRESGQLHAPIDVEAVAKHLGIRVEYAKFDDDCSGVLVKSDDGTAVIGVNWDHHPNRKRFTIAHEIGHFVLKHEGGTFVDKGTYARFRDRDAYSGKVRDEREANQFAAALLMPKRLVGEVSQDERVLDPSDDEALASLARAFLVSPQAMMFRLQRLGFLKAGDSPF
ncbi:MAG: ImmA/IrrE family metallo-endopeptidase [bacterium]|nr:ImmA/IrrE family metallo-endopeptidase [bacterium]